MKLQDFIPDIMTEAAFNTRFDSVKWEIRHDVYAAKASIDDAEFEMTIEPSTFEVAGKDHVFLNLGFSRMTDDGPTEKLIATGKDQSRAFGALKNAIADKVDELDEKFDNIDAIVMMIVAGEEKRSSMYNRLLTSRLHGFTKWTGLRTEIKMPNGTAIVGMKKKLSIEEFANLKTAINERGKSI